MEPGCIPFQKLGKRVGTEIILDRDSILETVRQENRTWDILVIGGGATGLGAALDAASRGYKTLLIEQHDFSKATSSRSTKLIHGGVRYLQQGNVSLVFDALHERKLLARNAPHIVREESFVIPGYRWWEKPFYSTGLKIYDLLAGPDNFGRSRRLSVSETIQEVPTLRKEGLGGGVRYYDGQFDDARLAIALMRTIFEEKGIALNYVKAISILKENERVSGVEAKDMETGETFPIHAKAVINAGGIFSDEVRRMDNRSVKPILQLSQGAHIVLDRRFQPGRSALLIPRTEDGRVLFAVPWHDRVVVGTTDTPVANAELEPVALKEEVEFLLSHISCYLIHKPDYGDIKSLFAGVRPLVQADSNESTKNLSRDHTILMDRSGLITITGGKWTTYRKMAEDVIDRAAEVAGLERRACRTDRLPIHGWTDTLSPSIPPHWRGYGSDAEALKTIENEIPDGDAPLHPDLPVRPAEIIWAARKEMARTVEDVLSRRSRSLLLDAKASMEIAPTVAKWLAIELKLDKKWEEIQIREFREIARRYLPFAH